MEPKERKVIILMATHNGSKHIQEQLDSFVSQTHSNWELIVSDDGSTDETRAIVDEFAQTISQKVLTVEGPRQGFWKNFLSLVDRTEEAHGDFFAYSDQDDIWLPDKLERATRWLGKGRQ